MVMNCPLTLEFLDGLTISLDLLAIDTYANTLKDNTANSVSFRRSIMVRNMIDCVKKKVTVC